MTRHPSAPGGDTVVLVQVLRGLAAALVLLGHTQEQLRAAALKAGLAEPARLAWPGGFGVDLFFCISGFIMVLTSARLAGQPGAAGEFLVRRAIRLVPLYWLATGLYLLVLALGTRGLPAQPLTALWTSLAFLPYPVDGLRGGMAYPLLSLGWSLNYEVLFYLLFASLLALPMHRLVAGVWALLLALVAAGAWLQPEATAPAFWTRPIVLEFGLGMLLGQAWHAGWRLPGWAALGLGIAALAGLLADPLGLLQAAAGTSTANDARRLLGWGLPAAALLLALTGYERGQRERVARWPLAGLVRLGDWSYALYLFHPFALLALTRLWLSAGEAHRPGLPLLGLLMLAGSVLLAALVHARLDRPLTRLLNRRWRERRPPLAPAAHARHPLT
ncbi:MAG: acyltransferase [Roseateles depolymerans]|uniref:Acyltransferase n=1 Tax=Roseateles depolymerans TaxID=76731 RepID=A0A2W5FRB2_9BURK|nr:MAG: acyltransferase [Roseateles depolymerans]